MNRKINKKGFTLTEILAVIAILGVILAIAVPSYNSLSKKFEKAYYEKLEGSVLAAAKSYYKENAESRPAELLYSSVVTFSELKENKNIDDIKGYKSNIDLKGRIIIVKKVEGYDYKMCYLEPGTNDESSTEAQKLNDASLETLGINKDTNTDNCDVNWLSNKASTFATEYGDVKPIYLYYSETNNPKTIKEKLGVRKTLKKRASYSSENYLATVELGNTKYYPENITAIDLRTAKEQNQTYNLIYRIKTEADEEGNKDLVVEKKLHVVRYDAPIVKVGDEEINGKTLPYNTEINLSISDDDATRHKNLKNDNATEKTIFEEKIYCGGTWRDWTEVSNGKKIYTKNSVNCDASSIKIKYHWKDEQDNISRETKEPYTMDLIEENPKLEVKLESGGKIYELGQWTNKDIDATLNVTGIKRNVDLYSKKDSGTDTKFNTGGEGTYNYKITEETASSTYTFSLKEKDTSNPVKNGDNDVKVRKTVKIDKTSPLVATIITDSSYNKKYDSDINLTMSWTNKDLWFNAFVKDELSGIENVTFKLKSTGATIPVHWVQEPDDYKDITAGSILNSLTKRYRNYASNGYSRYILHFYEDIEDDVIINATDLAGNKYTKEVKIKLDKTPPSPPSIYFFGISTDKFYIISGKDNLSGVSEDQYKKPGSNDWKTYSSIIHLTAETGTYYAKSIDRAGNESTPTSKNYVKEETESKYTIYFDSNGGSGSMSPMKNISRNAKVTLTKNAFTKSGYNFMGWATSKNSSTIAYYDQQEVAGITSGSSITLYAVWKKGLVATFKYNKATWAKDTTASCNLYNGATSCTVTAPEIPNAPGTNRRDQSTSASVRNKGNNPYKTLFTVVGWSTNKNATSAQHKSRGTITLSANTTYYAIVKINKTRFYAFPNEDYGLYCRKAAGQAYAKQNFKGMILTNTSTAAYYNSTNWQYTGGKMWFVGNVDPSNLCSGGSLGVGKVCTSCWVPGDWVDW